MKQFAETRRNWPRPEWWQKILGQEFLDELETEVTEYLENLPLTNRKTRRIIIHANIQEFPRSYKRVKKGT